MQSLNAFVSWGSQLWPFKRDNSNSDLQERSLLDDTDSPPREPSPTLPLPLELAPYIDEVAPLPKLKNKQDNYVLNVCDYKLVPYWGEDDDDDDPNARVEIGAKQHAAFIAGTVVINSFSAYFYQTPIVSAAFASGAIEFTKTWYTYLDKDCLLKNGARVLAVSALIGTIFMRYGISDAGKATTIYQFLNAIPLSYPAMGILKAELSRAEIHKLIQKAAEKCNVTLSETQAKVVSALLQIAPALGLAMAKVDDSLSAASGIFVKLNIRELTNIAGKYLYEIESSTKRKSAGIAMGVGAVATTAIGYVGSYLKWFNNTSGTLVQSLLIMPGSDIAARTLKESVKVAIKEEKAALKTQRALVASEDTLPESILQRVTRYGKKSIEAALFTAPVIGASLAMGPMIDPKDKNTSKAGIVASVLGDAISVIKVATKRFDTAPVMTVAGKGILYGGAAYTLKELVGLNISWPLYSSALLLASISAAFELYHLRDLCRPPKRDEIEVNAQVSNV